MVLLAAVAGLGLLSPGGLMVSRSEEGLLVMGTTSERRVVVLLTPDTLLTVNGPKNGPAAALYARSGRVPQAAPAGQTWVSPPKVRASKDRLKELTTWVGDELGIADTPQTLEPNWLPAGSFRPETYLASGDLVQTALGGPTVAIRFDPEAGSLESQATRQREVDGILRNAARRYGAESPLTQLAEGGEGRIFLIAFRSSDVGLFDMLVRAPRVSIALRPRAEVVVLNVGEKPETRGAATLFRALLPRERDDRPAWAMIDGSGRVRATSAAVGEDGPVNLGGFTSKAAAAYFVRQLRRAVPLVSEADAGVIEQNLVGALPPVG